MSKADFKDCASCDKSGNNQYFSCPNRMSYGFMTDYRPKCAAVYQTLQTNQFNDSFSQRMFLTHNAEEIMKQNAQQFYMMMNCGECMAPYNVGTMLPEQTEQTCDSRTCTFRQTDAFGLGLSRKYYENDDEAKAKAAFIAAKEKEQQFFKENSQCCGGMPDDNYFPLDNNVMKQYPRTSVPGGGPILQAGDRVKQYQS